MRPRPPVAPGLTQLSSVRLPSVPTPFGSPPDTGWASPVTPSRLSAPPGPGANQRHAAVWPTNLAGPVWSFPAAPLALTATRFDPVARFTGTWVEEALAA